MTHRRRAAGRPPVGVARLVTVADLGDGDDPDPEGSRMAVSVRHEAELSDGRRVVVLDDRGWSSSGPARTWARETVEDIVGTVRSVVAPDYDVTEEDEARDPRARELAEAYHFAMIQGAVGQHGAVAHHVLLKELTHDVELTERLRARLPEDPGPGPH